MYQFIEYLNIICFSLTFIGALVVLFRSEWKLSLIFLCLSLLIIFLQNFLYYIITTGLFVKLPHYIKVPDPFLYLAGPSLYLFTRALLLNQKTISRWDYLHFLPFVLNFIDNYSFYTGNSEIKIEFINNLIKSDFNNSPFYQVGVLGNKLHTYGRGLSWFIYFILSVRLFRVMRKKIKSDVLTDYNIKFSIIKYVLSIKFIGYLFGMVGLFFMKQDEYLYIILTINSLINLSILLLIIFKYPELVFGKNLTNSDFMQREEFVKTAMEMHNSLRLIENSNYDINILVNKDFRIKYFNRVAKTEIQSLFGKKIEIDKDLRDFFPLTFVPDLTKSLNKAIEGKEINFEQHILTSSNKISYYEINFRPHYNELGQLISIAIGANNISDKKRMESLQEKYIESLDSLAWKSSHTLRAPVSNMKGIIEVLQSNFINKTPEEANELVGYLSSELNRLDNVIIDMVAKARKELEN